MGGLLAGEKVRRRTPDDPIGPITYTREFAETYGLVGVPIEEDEAGDSSP